MTWYMSRYSTRTSREVIRPATKRNVGSIDYERVIAAHIITYRGTDGRHRRNTTTRECIIWISPERSWPSWRKRYSKSVSTWARPSLSPAGRTHHLFTMFAFRVQYLFFFNTSLATLHTLDNEIRALERAADVVA